MTLPFESRADAAQQLALALAHYRGRNPLVLAIPRGAVAMGRLLADELGGELDVVLVRKLRAPSSAELAVGAVDESGWTYIADYAEREGADAAYLERERQLQLATLRKRRAQYTPARAPNRAEGRVVIVVDDGLATGASMIAALHAARAKQPQRLVCAVPVAPPVAWNLCGRWPTKWSAWRRPQDSGRLASSTATFHKWKTRMSLRCSRNSPATTLPAPNERRESRIAGRHRSRCGDARRLARKTPACGGRLWMLRCRLLANACRAEPVSVAQAPAPNPALRAAKWLLPAAILGLAAAALHGSLRDFRAGEIAAALRELPLLRLTLALAMAAWGYLVLAGYDLLDFRFIGRRLRYRGPAMSALGPRTA